MLRKLMIYLRPEVATDEQSLGMLKALLILWNVDDSEQSVYLRASYEQAFTRQAYADLLRKMGQVLEGWLQSSLVLSGADGEASEQRTEHRICVVLHDGESCKDWWGRHIMECFPTFARSHGLRMDYQPRECSSDLVPKHVSHLICCTLLAFHSFYKWEDSDALPPVPTAAAQRSGARFRLGKALHIHQHCVLMLILATVFFAANSASSEYPRYWAYMSVIVSCLDRPRLVPTRIHSERDRKGVRGV